MTEPKQTPNKPKTNRTTHKAAPKATTKKASTPKARPKRQRTPRTKTSRGGAPLTPAEQVFAEKLRECLPQERTFVRHKLTGRTNMEAARLAGYSAKSLETEGSRLLGRARVYEAYQAGLDAAGFGAKEVLADIQQLRNFHRSQIEREVKGVEMVSVEVPARQAVEELLKREEVAASFIATIDGDEEAVQLAKTQLATMRMKRLELEMELAINPKAMTVQQQELVVTKRMVDFDKAKELGLLKFVKGVKPTRFGDVVETYDWMTALEMAAKVTGVFKEHVEITGKDGEPLSTTAVIVLPSNGREG